MLAMQPWAEQQVEQSRIQSPPLLQGSTWLHNSSGRRILFGVIPPAGWGEDKRGRPAFTQPFLQQDCLCSKNMVIMHLSGLCRSLYIWMASALITNRYRGLLNGGLFPMWGVHSGCDPMSWHSLWMNPSSALHTPAVLDYMATILCIALSTGSNWGFAWQAVLKALEESIKVVAVTLVPVAGSSSYFWKSTLCIGYILISFPH